MIVKRKDPNLKGEKFLDNIRDKMIDQPSNNAFLQKIKEISNGYPLEFKGWVDLSSVEIFNGLQGKSSI
jgi:hypothetical protein